MYFKYSFNSDSFSYKNKKLCSLAELLLAMKDQNLEMRFRGETVMLCMKTRLLIDLFMMISLRSLEGIWTKGRKWGMYGDKEVECRLLNE